MQVIIVRVQASAGWPSAQQTYCYQQWVTLQDSEKPVSGGSELAGSLIVQHLAGLLTARDGRIKTVLQEVSLASTTVRE